MTVEEVAKKMGRTKWAIYKAIKRGSGVGRAFTRRAGDGWFAYAKDVKKFLKGGEQ